MLFHGWKVRKKCCLLYVQLLKSMRFCLVNKILVRAFNDCLQVLVSVQVGSVCFNEASTRMRQKGFFCFVLL